MKRKDKSDNPFEKLAMGDLYHGGSETGCIQQFLNSKRVTLSQRAQEAYEDGNKSYLKKVVSAMPLLYSSRRTKNYSEPVVLIRYYSDEGCNEDSSAWSLHSTIEAAENYFNPKSVLKGFKTITHKNVYPKGWIPCVIREVYVTPSYANQLHDEGRNAFYESEDC